MDWVEAFSHVGPALVCLAPAAMHTTQASCLLAAFLTLLITINIICVVLLNLRVFVNLRRTFIEFPFVMIKFFKQNLIYES